MRAFIRIAAVGVVASSLFGSISIGAQRGGGERSGPTQPPLFLSDDEYLRWPLPASEQAYDALSGRRIKSYIEEITAISRKSREDGQQYWGPHHRHAVRQDDDRLDRGAIPSRRSRAGPHPGIHRSAAAVVSDVVGSGRDWGWTIASAENRVSDLSLGRHRGDRVGTGVGRPRSARGFHGSRREGQSGDRLRHSDARRPLRFSGDQRIDQARGGGGRRRVVHRPRHSRQRHQSTDRR